MPFLIFFLVISLPVIEVASIVQVSHWVGPYATFLLLAAGVAFGAFLIRSQSMTMGRRALEAMQAGRPPELALQNSGAVILAGVLFMIPGFFTDILALLLLLPEARRLMWRGLSFGMRGRTPSAGARPRTGPPPQPHRSEDVIDVEFTEVPKERDAGDGGVSGSVRKDTPWGKT
jgi:UPF0716 protein FxsA